MRWLIKSNALAFARRYTTNAVKETIDTAITPDSANATSVLASQLENTIKSNEDEAPANSKDFHLFNIKKNLARWISEQDVNNLPNPKEKFTIFPILSSNPIRKNIPEIPESISKLKFKEITENDKENILEYFKQLTRYSYPKKEKNVQKAIKPLYKKYRSLPEIKDEYLYFVIKKNNGEVVDKLLRGDPEYYKRPQTYSSLLDMTLIFKNSKASLINLRSLTKRLADNKIPLTNELIYKLNYTLPNKIRHFFINEVNQLIPTDEIISDASVFKINSYDKLKNDLIIGDIDFTYASYIQLVKTMIKENRLIEGLNFIQHLIFLNQCEIPLLLCKYTADMALAHNIHLCIPISISLQRITGCSLKVYTFYRVETSLVASKILNNDLLVLFKLLFNSSSWRIKQLTDSVINNIEKSDLTDEEKGNLIRYFLLTKEEMKDDIIFNELNQLFTTLYSSNDISFKPGFDNSIYEPIYKLFPSYNRFNTLRAELNKAENLNEFWEHSIKTYSQTNPPLFTSLCQEVVYNFIENNKLEKIFPFVKYMKDVYNINIEYLSYLRLFTDIVKKLNPDSLNKSRYRLAVLLAYKLNLNQYTVCKAFNDLYPITSEIYNKVDKTESDDLNDEWFELIDKVSWPKDSSPSL